jgi:cytochrome b pre-mRNA-processing protein 3
VFAGILRRSGAGDQTAERLYRQIVAQARQPALYAQLGVPDTVEGRLEMILLHLVLLFRRLHGEGDDGQSLAQSVFDRFVSDMDRSLREMGVGDLAVPKRMKAIGRSFYGRLDAYGKPIAERDQPVLTEALRRNLWPDGAPPADRSGEIADYAGTVASTLQSQPFPNIARGEVVFPHPGNAEGRN